MLFVLLLCVLLPCVFSEGVRSVSRRGIRKTEGVNKPQTPLYDTLALSDQFHPQVALINQPADNLRNPGDRQVEEFSEVGIRCVAAAWPCL